MNPYEEKQERRRERLQKRADRTAQEAKDKFAKADAISERFYMGQPILVGHHSEARSRRDHQRVDDNMRKGIALEKTAQEIQHQVEAVGTGGISSDDPEAVRKLREELAVVQSRQGVMKTANKFYRLNKTLAGLELEPGLREYAESSVKMGYGLPFPRFHLTNNGASARRIQKRIDHLLAEAQRVERPDIIGNGFRISENKEENRIILKLDVRLSKEDFRYVRSMGWLWSPTRSAFVRQLHNSARYAADFMADELNRRLEKPNA